MSRIFLSHSSLDNGSAVALRDWLVSEGWDDLFLDVDPERGIGAGERWERALNEAAHRCEAVLFLVSLAWLRSAWCIKEFHLAAKLNKRMFGVLIEDIAIKDLPAELTATWQMVDLVKGSDHVMFRASLPDGREEHLTFSKAGLSRLKTGLTRAGLDPRFFAWPPENDLNRPPYRGLRPLEAEDAGIFFGREAPIIETLDRLRGLRESAPPRFLAILGASGAGKSSFLRAGLIPRLARDDRSFLVLPVIRPERAVLSGETGLLRSLEEALVLRGFKPTRAEINKAVTNGPAAILALLSQLADKARVPKIGDEVETPPPAFILAIDQGEELFQAEGAEESQGFLTLIHDLVLAQAPQLIILVTVRSDAYERLQSVAALEGVHQHTLSLPPLPRGAYQTVIEGPANRLRDTKRALKIEPQLTAALMADIETGGAKDALPLLAFTLERLYLEHGGDGDLKLSEYRDIGGIAGSIEAAVARALKAADTDPSIPRDHAQRLALMRRAFIPWLAGIDPETGSPRRAIARLTEIPEEARPIVRHLIDQRLLATDVSQSGEQTIEPAHEALLRQWGLLQGWLQEDLAQLSALEGVKRATRDWLANAKSSDWLAHAAGRLEDAESLTARPDLAAKLDASDRDYLSTCRKAETDRKDRELHEARKLVAAQKLVATRTRIGIIVASLLFVTAAGVGWYGIQKTNEANELKREAERQAMQAEAMRQEAEKQRAEAEKQKQTAFYNDGVALSGLSRVALAESAPSRAVRLALAAWPRKGDTERPALRRTLESLAAALPLHNTYLPLKGHTEGVSSVAFSPDGTLMLTASNDRTILWDRTTGRQLHRLIGDEYQIQSAAFSPDGQSVMTVSWDRTVRLWRTKTGAALAVLKHQESIRSAAFSPDGTRVVTVTDKTARIWNAATGAQTALLVGHEKWIEVAAFSPDSQRVVTASADQTAKIWNAGSGQEIATLKGHTDELKDASFSPDGKLIVTASRDKTARIWNTDTGATIATLPDSERGLTRGHEEGLISAAFSPDGSSVLTSSWDGTLRLWRGPLRWGELEYRIFRQHGGEIKSAQFSADGKRILSASSDKTAILWDVMAQIPLAILTHEGGVTSAALARDGKNILTASGTAVSLWNVPERELSLIGIYGPIIGSANFSPDGKLIVAPSREGAEIWDVETERRITEFKHAYDCKAEKFGDANVLFAAFSADSSQVVTGCNNGTVRIWDVKNGRQVATLRGHQGAVRSAAFSPDGKVLVTGSDDGTARLWNPDTGELMVALLGHGGEVTSVSFSPNGDRILSASQDETVRIWSTSTGRQLKAFRGGSSAVFAPDGEHIATGGGSGKLLNISTGETEVTFTAPADFISQIAFSPDGTRLATTTNSSVRIWDVATGLEIARFHTRPDSISFSPDGKKLAAYAPWGPVWLWDISKLEKGDAVSIACTRLGKDIDLADIRERYGLGDIKPICGTHPPQPVDLKSLQ